MKSQSTVEIRENIMQVIRVVPPHELAAFHRHLCVMEKNATELFDKMAIGFAMYGFAMAFDALRDERRCESN